MVYFLFKQKAIAQPMTIICQPFERTDGILTLKDAICLTQGQWDAITDEELAAMQDRRWLNWIAVVTAPPVEPAPQPEV